MPAMQFDFDGLIEILARHLYSEKNVFIRELVQNAHDGIRRRAGEDPAYTGRVDIETRPSDLTIRVRDNGIGMSDVDLRDYLSNVGKSLTKIEKAATASLIGQFGIGFLSAFVVASRVEVRTRRLGQDQGWTWTNDGAGTYEIAPCDGLDVGTTVVVHLKGVEERGVIAEESVREVIRRYADMLLVPIHLNGHQDPENTMYMPWERSGRSAEELEFESMLYLERSVSDRVLEVIPVALENPHASGVLYITQTRAVGVDSPRTVRLFQSRMFLQDNATDILPKWARFVNGVINTSAVTPTAARDNFIRDDAAEQLRDRLGDIVVTHLEMLRKTNFSRFARILEFHQHAFKAACFYYSDFYKRFAALLPWRTNRGSDVGPGPHRPMMRTLPEIVELLPPRDSGPQRLACFTTRNTASQYFQMADSAGTVVVDASDAFEAELLEDYLRLEGVNLQLVHVDREDDPNVFAPIGPADQQVKKLAEAITLVVGSGSVGHLRVEARSFHPVSISAIIRSDAMSRAQQKAEEIRLDPNASADLREMAEELAVRAANASRKLTINARNPLIQRLSAHRLDDPAAIEVMKGVYNSAILGNQELLTPQDAQVLYDQYQTLLTNSLSYLETEAELAEIRQRMRVDQDRKSDASARHLIVFMIVPFAERYRSLIDACRALIEDRWGCQLIVASDRHHDDRLLENVRALMSQAGAFLAEITEGNPNVMFELGAAYADRRDHPILLLRDASATAGPASAVPAEVPADLRGLLYAEYDIDSTSVIDSIGDQLRRNAAFRRLLDSDRPRFLSDRRLRDLLPFRLQAETYQRLADSYPTVEDWVDADVADVADLLGTDGDLAEPIIHRIVGSRS